MKMTESLAEYFKCPPRYASVMADGELSPEKVFFKYGSEVVCFGRSSEPSPELVPSSKLYDASQSTRPIDGRILLAFDPDEVLRDLRLEVYAERCYGKGFLNHSFIDAAYYWLRPFLPVQIRKHLQKIKLRDWNALPFPRWPVDCTVDRLCEELLLANMKAQGYKSVPFIWFWPKEHPSAVMMTHDVETERGRDYSENLMNIDDSFGIKASFQVVQ
jgi:hypothetical protein